MLYVVGTPIGNLNDITVRALEVLKQAVLIAAEDTRHSGNLLRHFEIQKPLLSYHEHNEARRTAELVERLATGETIALITDAGMPGLSDPGSRLIRKVIERNLPFTIVPGVSAITTALVGSGFQMERFCYRGFLPVKSGQRARELQAAAERPETTVFFESPYRIKKTLTACGEFMPSRMVCVARELTKKFEEFRRGTAVELLAHYDTHPSKGEITLLVAGIEGGELWRTLFVGGARLRRVWAQRHAFICTVDGSTESRSTRWEVGFPLVNETGSCDFLRLFPRPWLTQLSKRAADNIASPK